MLKRSLALMCALALPNTLLALNNKLLTNDAVSLEYAADIRFAWHEPLTQIGAETSSINTLYPQNLGVGYRNLGLRSAAFQLLGGIYSKSFFSVGFRPDVHAKEVEAGYLAPRDFDSRSGTTYRPKPRIFLLNDYQVGLNLGEQFDLSYGVWSGFDLPFFKLSDLNEFGLAVQLPANFSAARFRLKKDAAPDAKAGVSVFVSQGRGERVDRFSRNNRSADVSMTSLNPYWAGAVLFRCMKDADWDLGLLAGYEQRRAFNGSVQETYGVVSVSKQFIIWERKLNLGLDGRLTSEKWHQTSTPRPALMQASSSFFTKMQIIDPLDFVLGLHVGKSERVDLTWGEKQTFRGTQIDLGLSSEFRKNLSLAAFVSNEIRSLLKNGQHVGGFEYNDRHRIVRLGVDLRYLL